MDILSDDEWARPKAAPDAARSGTGRPFPDERRTVEAVVWRQRDGAEWRAVPPEPGPWRKAARLHIRWSRTGVRERAFARQRDAGRTDLGEVLLDGTSGRARHEAAGAKGGCRACAGALARRRSPPRTRSGGTKACAVRDGAGRPLGFAPIPGRASGLRAAPAPLLAAAPPGTIRRVAADACAVACAVADAACPSAAWFAPVVEAGAAPVVRPDPTHPRAKHFDHAAQRRRHKVESCWAGLEEWRAIATRYDKTAASFSGGLHLAAAFEWLSNRP